MAFNFTPELPVLNFGPKHHARWRTRKYVLWPAFAYRVVAPRVRRRKLNVLQRAIMGLCRAGLYRADVIAEHLSIHIDLAALIVAELSDLSYLDALGLPTERGMRVLEDDAVEAEDMVAGYVFQDPWKGDLWPRFVESLDYCELRYRAHGFPSLLFGSTGKQRSEQAFMVLPRSQLSPLTPSAKAIVEAVRSHRSGLRFKDAIENDDEFSGDFTASGVQIERVSFIEEDPQAVFLMTYLYVPESESGALDWFACDPFGIGRSARLRRRVEEAMRDDPNLFSLVNTLVGETLHLRYSDQRQWQEAIEMQAAFEVGRQLAVNVREHPSFEHLLAMESARLEMRALGEGCPERKIKEAMRCGLKVLESVFAAMTRANPLGDVWKRVYVRRFDQKRQAWILIQEPDREVLEATYRGAIRDVGFSEPIPESLLKVPPGQVRSVADYGQLWRLRPLLAATLLLAQADPTHPMRGAAQTDAHLLAKLEDIASTGGGAGHADGGSVSVEEAENIVNKTYAAVSTLLGLGSERAIHTISDAGGTSG